MNTKMFIGFDSWQSGEHDIRINMEMDSKPKIATTLAINIVWPIEDVVGPFKVVGKANCHDKATLLSHLGKWS